MFQQGVTCRLIAATSAEGSTCACWFGPAWLVPPRSADTPLAWRFSESFTRLVWASTEASIASKSLSVCLGVGGLKAEIHILLRPDGAVQSVEPMDLPRMSADPAFRTFAESAVRAVRACSPLKLPPESYQVWRNVIVNFDPSLLTG